MRVTENDLILLELVRNGEVTWRSDIGGRKTFRLWATETEYETVTVRAKRLERAGLIDCWHGYSHGRGGIDLTAAGKELLAARNGGTR